MDEISDHFDTMRSHCLLLFAGESNQKPGCLWWCGAGFRNHPQYYEIPIWSFHDPEKMVGHSPKNWAGSLTHCYLKGQIRRLQHTHRARALAWAKGPERAYFTELLSSSNFRRSWMRSWRSTEGRTQSKTQVTRDPSKIQSLFCKRPL